MHLSHRARVIGYDTVKSASYLDLHLELDNKGPLKTKLYDKRDDFSFPILNFPFLSSKIPAAPDNGGIYLPIDTIFPCLHFLS